jgi:hypothetical protein
MADFFDRYFGLVAREIPASHLSSGTSKGTHLTGFGGVAPSINLHQGACGGF